MADQITIVGIGPGHPDYVPPIAMRAITSAQVLVGSKRALETYADSSQLQIEITGDLAAVADGIIQHYSSKRVAVMVSGDPGFYSLLPFLLKHFRPEEIEVIPGIGSMQTAFCQAKTVWHDAQLVSLHGRDFASVQDILAKPGKMGFLTDHQHSPAVIARYLLDLGWPNCKVFLCERLSYPDQRICETDLMSTLHEPGFKHGIMVVMEHV